MRWTQDIVLLSATLLLARIVSAHDSLTILTPSSVTEGQAVVFSWTGGDLPVDLTMLCDGKVVAQTASWNQRQVQWTPSSGTAPVGTKIQIQIKEPSGEKVGSSPVSVVPGEGDSHDEKPHSSKKKDPGHKTTSKKEEGDQGHGEMTDSPTSTVSSTAPEVTSGGQMDDSHGDTGSEGGLGGELSGNSTSTTSSAEQQGATVTQTVTYSEAGSNVTVTITTAGSDMMPTTTSAPGIGGNSSAGPGLDGADMMSPTPAPTLDSTSPGNSPGASTPSNSTDTAASASQTSGAASAEDSSSSEPSTSSSTTKYIVFALIFLVIAACAGGGGWYWYSHRNSSQDKAEGVRHGGSQDGSDEEQNVGAADGTGSESEAETQPLTKGRKKSGSAKQLYRDSPDGQSKKGVAQDGDGGSEDEEIPPPSDDRNAVPPPKKGKPSGK